MSRKFAPLSVDHPLVVELTPCAACKVAFVAGDETTLVPLGPGNNPEARQLAAEGRPYNAVAAVVHWTCHTGGAP